MPKSWKEKIVEFIKSVTEPQIQELKEELNRCKQREQDLLQEIGSLEENVRNNNALLDSLFKDNRFGRLEENVRSINALLDSLFKDNRFGRLEENVRNNSALLDSLFKDNRLDRLEENVRNNSALLDSLFKDNRLDKLEENVRNNNVLLNALQNGIKPEIIEARIEVLKSEIKRLKERTADATGIEVTTVKLEDSSVAEDTYDNIDYFSFENCFRGNEELIRQRQEIYLPYFEGSKKVLDLGCGRGEFLEMLREHGIEATGVDFYEEFAIYCRNKGLDVVTGDAISYLKEIPDKVDGIFAGQLVEHLKVEQIMALCKNAYDKLEKGKYLVMETPNPTSLAIYTHAFYIDPSHQRPVHPLTLKYFAEKAGFKDVQILFTEVSKLEETIPKLQGSGIDNLDEFNESMQTVANYLYGSQDYAIIAKK